MQDKRKEERAKGAHFSGLLTCLWKTPNAKYNHTELGLFVRVSYACRWSWMSMAACLRAECKSWDRAVYCSGLIFWDRVAHLLMQAPGSLLSPYVRSGRQMDICLSALLFGESKAVCLYSEHCVSRANSSPKHTKVGSTSFLKKIFFLSPFFPPLQTSAFLSTVTFNRNNH